MLNCPLFAPFLDRILDTNLSCREKLTSVLLINLPILEKPVSKFYLSRTTDNAILRYKETEKLIGELLLDCHLCLGNDEYLPPISLSLALSNIVGLVKINLL